MDAVRSKGQLPSVPALAIIAHMAGRLVHIHLDEERLDEEEVESLDLPSLCRLPDSRTFVITLPAAGAAVAYYRDAGGRLCRATAFCRWAAILHSYGILALVISGVAHRLAYLEAGPEGLSLAHCENIRFCPASHFYDILSTSSDDGYLAIGEAGERRSPLAACRTDSCLSFARGGLAATMGQMNFKGIMAHSNGPLEEGNLPKLPKSRLLKDMAMYGNGVLLDFGLRNGWLPIRHFSGKYDPRAAFLDGRMAIRLYTVEHSSCPSCQLACHLSEAGEALPGWQDAMSLGGGMGIFSSERVKVLCSKCAELGLDSVSAGEVLATLNVCDNVPYTYPVVKGASLDELCRILSSIASRKGVGELVSAGFDSLDGSVSVSGRAVGFDLRGAHAQALFTVFGELTPCYVDLVRKLSVHLDEEDVGRAAAWIRIFTHALEARGVPAFYMLPLHFARLPLLKATWRLVMRTFRIPGVGNRRLVREGLASVDAMDGANEGEASLPEIFSFPGTVGYTDELSLLRLMEGYKAEMARIRASVK